jgi:hypothetical protein
MGWANVAWINLAKDREKRRDVVQAAMNIYTP